MSELAPNGVLTWLRADLRRFDLLVAIVTTAVASLMIAGASERFDTGWPEVAAGVGVFFLLLGRRHFGRPLLAVALAWTALHFAVWERPTPMILATVTLLATVCVSLERRQAIALGSALGAVLYMTSLIVLDVAPGDARAVIGLVWAALAVGIADATRSWRRYRESFEAQLQSTVAAAEARTRQQVSEERLAIARELHDLLAHSLSVMNVQTGAAHHLLRIDPDQAEQSLVAARGAGTDVLDGVRELLTVLRHDDAIEAAATTSLPTIEELSVLIDSMRAAGLQIEWRRSGDERTLTAGSSLAAYRIIQEALTNAAKHGDGSATVVTKWDDERLSMQVVNAPGSPDESSGGLGLIGIRERAAVNGGEATAGLIGHEFVVDAWVPTATVRMSDDRSEP